MFILYEQIKHVKLFNFLFLCNQFSFKTSLSCIFYSDLSLSLSYKRLALLEHQNNETEEGCIYASNAF